MEPDCASMIVMKAKGYDLRGLRYMRLLRFLKFVRLLKYNRAIKQFFDKLDVSKGSERMLLIAITCFFLVHLMACIFFLINFFGDFPPDGWVVRNGMIDEPPSVQYLSALDWAFQTLTTVGYGSVTAGTYQERFFNLIWMLFGVGFYSFTIGNLSSIIASIDVKAEYLKYRLQILSTFVRRTNMPAAIENNVKRFLDNNKDEELKEMDKKKLLNELPSMLRGQIFHATYGKIVKVVRFFDNKP